MVFNMDVPDIMLSGLQEKLPAITSCLSSFAEKYQLFRYAAQLNNIIIYYTEEVQNIANNHAPNLSQISILFRNTVVRYQKTVQVFFNAAIRFLRETHVRLPGSEEMTTPIEVLNKMTSSITSGVEKAIQLVTVTVEDAFSAIIRMISKIQVTMPIGDVMAGGKIIDKIRDRVKALPNHVVDAMKRLESLDMLLEKLSDTLKFFVDKAQDFVDNALKSDVFDAVAVYINACYDKHESFMKTVTKFASTVGDIESINGTINYILDVFRSVVNQFNYTVTDYVQQVPAQYRAYVKVKGGKLEINL